MYKRQSQSFENELAGESVTLYMEMDARLSQLISSQDGALKPVKFYTIPALGQYQVNQLAGIPQGSFGSREDQMFADSTANRSSINEYENKNEGEIIDNRNRKYMKIMNNKINKKIKKDKGEKNKKERIETEDD
ncbi:hypothetical protein, partial [Brachyspira hyodysenteriae]|uniref:hypothetical protein n=1 Tax=Brachyspira hyodysenteriae TaxID=159 RepID=UPI003F66DFA9